MSYARRDDCDYTKILRNVKKKRKEFSKKTFICRRKDLLNGYPFFSVFNIHLENQVAVNE